MTNKEAFIKIIQKEIFDNDDIYGENYEQEFPLAMAFWEDFKNGKSKSSEKMTENGAKLLSWMQARFPWSCCSRRFSFRLQQLFPCFW